MFFERIKINMSYIVYIKTKIWYPMVGVQKTENF